MAKAKFDHAAFAEGLAQKRHDEISTLLRKLIDSCRTDHPDMQRAFTQRDVTIRRVNDVQEKMSSNHTLIMDTLNNILQQVQLKNIPSAIGTGNKQGVWMDRGYIAKIEQKAAAYDKVFGPNNRIDSEWVESAPEAFARTKQPQDPYADIVKAVFGDTTVPVGVARDMHRLEERVGTLELALEDHKTCIHGRVDNLCRTVSEQQEVISRHHKYVHSAIDSVDKRNTEIEDRIKGLALNTTNTVGDIGALKARVHHLELTTAPVKPAKWAPKK